jgi:hypothetical protein
MLGNTFSRRVVHLVPGAAFHLSEHEVKMRGGFDAAMARRARPARGFFVSWSTSAYQRLALAAAAEWSEDDLAYDVLLRLVAEASFDWRRTESVVNVRFNQQGWAFWTSAAAAAVAAAHPASRLQRPSAVASGTTRKTLEDRSDSAGSPPGSPPASPPRPISPGDKPGVALGAPAAFSLRAQKAAATGPVGAKVSFTFAGGAAAGSLAPAAVGGGEGRPIFTFAARSPAAAPGPRPTPGAGNGRRRTPHSAKSKRAQQARV